MISTSVAANGYDRSRGVDGQHALADPTINLLVTKLKTTRKSTIKKISQRALRETARSQQSCHSRVIVISKKQFKVAPSSAVVNVHSHT
jgi:hypothetical protein